MRRWIGSLVLATGAAGLGWYAQAVQAPAIEADIAVRAQVLAAQAPHGVTVDVSGRDLRLAGLSAGADRAGLVAAFGDLDGVRVVEAMDLRDLPVASPFTLRVTQTAGGRVAQGAIPSETLRDLPGLGETDQVQLASGAPDAAWGDALRVGLAGLNLVQNGEMVLLDRALTLTGTVDTPSGQRAVLDALGALPTGYAFADQVEVLDDGAPLFFRYSTTDGRAEGKLPLGLTADDLSIVLNGADLSGLTEARIPMGSPDWPDALLSSLAGAAALIDADLSMDETSVTLTGRGTPDGLAAAEQALAAVPPGIETSLDLTLWDDGAPLVLDMAWDGAEATATGKLPAGFAPRGPGGVVVTLDTDRSFLPDDSGAFTANADAGVAALGLLSSGKLTATADGIDISGVAASPQVGRVMDDILVNAAAGAQITRSLTFLDDGSPAAWQLTYSPLDGALVEGRLPVGLGPDDLAGVLGLDGVASNAVTAVEDDTQGRAAEVLTGVLPYLGDIEQLDLSQNGSGTAIDLILSPGVDIDLVAADLAQNLPLDVAFSVGPLDPPPPAGTARRNVATGLTEVFVDGFWIPDLDFVTSIDGCAAATRAQLGAAGIGFVSGSARLDASALRVLNGLAAVARPCVEADLELEIAGHTDASGDADLNQILSQDRAEVVRAALIARGIPARAITAIGFGASQPIADNATPEGRSANRRTEISWFERGALRDP